MAVTDEQLDHLETQFGIRLPALYRDYLKDHGPGQIDAHPDFYVELSDIETIAAVNDELRDLFPGLFYIGSDGSREQLAFDYSRDPRRSSSPT